MQGGGAAHPSVPKPKAQTNRTQKPQSDLRRGGRGFGCGPGSSVCVVVGAVERGSLRSPVLVWLLLACGSGASPSLSLVGDGLVLVSLRSHFFFAVVFSHTDDPARDAGRPAPRGRSVEAANAAQLVHLARVSWESSPVQWPDYALSSLEVGDPHYLGAARCLAVPLPDGRSSGHADDHECTPLTAAGGHLVDVRPCGFTAPDRHLTMLEPVVNPRAVNPSIGEML